jgi:hypothetical protein
VKLRWSIAGPLVFLRLEPNTGRFRRTIYHAPMDAEG